MHLHFFSNHKIDTQFSLSFHWLLSLFFLLFSFIFPPFSSQQKAKENTLHFDDVIDILVFMSLGLRFACFSFFYIHVDFDGRIDWQSWLNRFRCASSSKSMIYIRFTNDAKREKRTKTKTRDRIEFQFWISKIFEFHLKTFSSLNLTNNLKVRPQQASRQKSR